MCCYSFENRNWDKKISMFILNIELSASKQCNNTMNITLFVLYLQMLFLFHSTVTFPSYSWGGRKTEGIDVAYLRPCCLLYCRTPNWTQASFIWINSVSLQWPLVHAIVPSEFCLTTKTTTTRKCLRFTTQDQQWSIWGKHYKRFLFICSSLIRIFVLGSKDPSKWFKSQ